MSDGPLARRVYRLGSVVLVGLALFAFVLVLIGIAQPAQPPRADEGPLARLFQLAILALLPTAMLVLATADWRQPRAVARLFMGAGVLVVLAFVALYYAEHVR